ncbi:uncharacterized protein HGUI_03281 [Hanseniaspora guilliermondii]|uniref:Uncharacterized protein n=1 Tax=Hanseniaspora guilliermondii TaxID=56406 RepID=A0A1L0CRA7_9ASCO|nr:uncharacterized protein HGUI_03281 [Hanseniaspora guilliermondii]
MEGLFNDLDPLLLTENEKFQVNKYLSLYLKNNSSNSNFLDINSLIIKLEKYLQNDIINNKYASIFQKYYSTLITWSKSDIIQKHHLNKKLFLQLDGIMEIINYFNNNNEYLNKAQTIISVLINSYNLRFVITMAESIQRIIIDNVHEVDSNQNKTLSLYLENFKYFNIILELIDNVVGICNITYFENIQYNITIFKTEHFKYIVEIIIEGNYIENKDVWKQLLKISKRDFKSAIDECLKHCINTTDLQFINAERLVNEIVNKSHKIILLETYLDEEIEVNNANENKMLKMSGLKLYIKEKFGYNNKIVASLHNLYIVKISKNIKSKSITIQDNKKHEIMRLLNNKFDEDELLKKPHINAFALKKLNDALSS